MPPKTACFFSHEPRAQLQKEQYSLQDIRILQELGFDLTIATTFDEVPWGADVYFSWWASGSVLPLIKARLRGRPIVVVAGGNEATLYRDSLTGAPYGYLATPWYKKIATRLTLLLATRVLVVSHFMVPDALRLGAREPVVVPNSVDVSRFRPARTPRDLVTTIFNLDDPVVTIKRAEVFFQAAALVLKERPDQRFVVIGHKGNAYPRMLELVRSLGIEHRIEFLGSIANADVIDWLQRSRAYVQISDTETFGVAVAEAMSAGVPVVVSRRGALPELVSDCGTFVNHNDPTDVAQGVLNALRLSDADLARRGLAARERIATHYSYEKRLATMREVLQGLF
jgi:glycosyltransferase involved in cell wall biosynthesis